MTMSGNGNGQSSRGIWMIALATLGLLAMVAWDQLHVRSGGRPVPTPAARPLAEAPAASPADTAVTISPPVPPAPTPAVEPEGESGPDDSADGRHAI
jgi:hypothetical protein